ncbi:MAG: substrate-binding domain-containing protein [Lautropia sp.]
MQRRAFNRQRRVFNRLPLVVLSGMPLTAAAQAGPTTIGVALASDVNPFYIAMRRGIEARAKELGVATVFVTANEVVAQQVDGIQDLVSRKVDGILVSPIDSVAVAAGYAAAGKASIPVISVGRHANSPYQSAYVTMDEKGIGRDIAAWIAKRIGGSGKIAMLTGPSGSATFRNIVEGFDGELRNHPGVQVVYRKEAAPNREAGLKQGEDILVGHPDVVAIYCANDDMALGVSQAIASAGRQGKVVATGMNGTPPALRAVKSQAIGMTVELNPVAWGRLAVDTMVNYLKGNKPSADVAISHKLIDASNVDQALPR